jgi:hypothetical protein
LKTLSKLTATVLVAVSLLMSTGCSTKSGVVREGQAELVCNEEALAPRPESPKDEEVPAGDMNFKLWAAKLLQKYLILEEQDSQLLGCWNREADKRKAPD